MTIVNRVPTLKPRGRCGFVRESKLGAMLRCTLVAGHDEGRPHRPAGSPSRHYFAPLSDFDENGQMIFKGRIINAPRDLYRGYIDPFERIKARQAAAERVLRAPLDFSHLDGLRKGGLL
ncbi:hypothetical protein KNU64_gp65 [Gordonia Phage Lollipop1437]|uniref:Uncharacterized protein n=1 Tax=Gordonia Phage Lollipop1437 TaxID=2588505 RepID=A0A4Y6ETG7_9CAUD|nr:hypothetical protein KNU64_gp65 [Gordonia Phage Lollipop1437]QDF19169.1 hypothetical protein SEA_LOLLIPOP1437_65 [Gordonia Phage Lollipop1437]